jgi:hypothetical protein
MQNSQKKQELIFGWWFEPRFSGDSEHQHKRRFANRALFCQVRHGANRACRNKKSLKQETLRTSFSRERKYPSKHAREPCFAVNREPCFLVMT